MRFHLSRWPPHGRAQWELAMYGAAFFLVIIFSFEVGFASNAVVAVWPASGIATCAALKHGWRAFIPIALGGLCYSLVFQSEGPLLLYTLNNMSNALAACCAVALYRRLGESTAPFSSLAAVSRTVFVLAVGHGALAAVAGAGLVGYWLDLSRVATWSLGWRWFFSDFSGVMLVLPAAVSLTPHIWRPKRAIERAFVGGSRRLALLATMVVAFVLVLTAGVLPGEGGAYPLVLLTMPLCTWLAFRSDTSGTLVLLSFTITVALMQALMGVGTATGETFLTVQLYAMVVMCNSLFIHAASIERREAVRTLALERANLEATVASRTTELRSQVTAYEEIKSELEALVNTDSLSGVANRRAFFDRGRMEVSRHHRTGEALSVLMVDVDHFKRINDTHGHAVGDQAIVAVAQCLAKELRDGTDMVARIGGEEFACLLGNTDGAAAVLTADRLRRAIASIRVQLPGGGVLGMTASLGVCSLDPTRPDLEGLIVGADDALYAAKRAGRDCVFDLASALAGEHQQAHR